ncbi:MAG TPA: hypothetical protein VMV81_03940 [Phycisphaerae bacterium]|nr:hypothetical protein [Phycisphaerae bacterium]
MAAFDEWVQNIFERYLRQEPEIWIEPPATVKTEFMTQLFEKPSYLVESFSEQHIALGLQYLLFNANSNYVFVLVDGSVPIANRVRLVNSFFTLFKELFSKICSEYCGGAQESKKRPADYVCFMMWDAGTLQIYPERPEQREVDRAFLSVLGRILDLPSIPCQKSALHGLNHAYDDYPDEVSTAIDEYLKSGHCLSDDLQDYALRARIGGVL